MFKVSIFHCVDYIYIFENKNENIYYLNSKNALQQSENDVSGNKVMFSCNFYFDIF